MCLGPVGRAESRSESLSESVWRSAAARPKGVSLRPRSPSRSSAFCPRRSSPSHLSLVSLSSSCCSCCSCCSCPKIQDHSLDAVPPLIGCRPSLDHPENVARQRTVDLRTRTNDIPSLRLSSRHASISVRRRFDLFAHSQSCKPVQSPSPYTTHAGLHPPASRSHGR